MGMVLLPAAAAMDAVAAALTAPVDRYDDIHGATSRLRGGEVDCVVLDADTVAVNVAGAVERLRTESDAAVVLAVSPEDASVAMSTDAAAVVDRSAPEAVARRLGQLRSERRLDRAERRSEGARERLRSAAETVRGSSDDSLDGLAEAVTAALGGTGPYPVAWIGQHDPDRGIVRPVAAEGIPDAHLRAIPVGGDNPAGASGTARAVRAEGTAIVEGGSADELGDGAGLLAVRIPTEPVAVLHLVAPRPGGVPEPECSALQELATTLSEAVGGPTDPARGGDDRVRLLADALAHELSNQLGAAGLQLDLAEEHGDPEHFEHVARALDRLEGMAAETRALAREEPELEWTDLETVTRTAWGAVSTTDATLDVEAGTLEADPALLRLALVNLLRNAVEHGRPADGDGSGTDDDADEEAEEGLHVEVGTVGEEGIYVADNGPGIPPAERERVLEWGHSVNGGTGVGLGLVRLAADRHGWSVRVTESDEGGTLVELGPAE